MGKVLVDDKKDKTLLNTTLNIFIVGFILLIFYYFAGHDFVRFYFSEKKELVKTAEFINALCNENDSCPSKLEGWQVHEDQTLSKGNMLYTRILDHEIKSQELNEKYLNFRLTYRFFLPDHWYEVEGGVEKQLNSGWNSR